MAEAARRTGYGHGSDVVRRLIARPLRMQGTQPARAAVAEPALVVAPNLDVAVEHPEFPEAPTPDILRLRTEMMLLKAVLQAERRENASLRAAVGFDEADEILGEEARVVRDRWASLVDRLLHAPA